MKQKLLLKTMLLLCALIVGSSSVWADSWEEVSLVNLTSSDVFVIVGNNYAMTNNNGTSSAPATAAVTIENGKITSTVTDNIKWTVSGNSTDGYTFYPNGSTKTWLYCNTTASSSSNNNMRVGTGDRKVFELTNANIVTKDDYTARYLSIYNNADWRGYVNTNSAPAIKFYKRVSSANTCATPTFDPAAGAYTSAQNVTISTTTEDATIYYTTDGTTPTTESSVYSSAISVSANTTIKALAVKATYDNSEIATANYTILQHAGTALDPYTVADARDAIDANSGIENVYVTGIVCTAGSSLNSGKMNYWISDDGTETNKLEAFKGKNLNNTNFTATTDVKVGDVVTIYGTLTKYGSTYEFAEGNYLTIHKVKPATPTFSVAEGLYTSAQSVALACETDGATIYYTTDGTEPTSGSTEYSTAITVNADMTIKAIAIKEGVSSDIASATYTINLSPFVLVSSNSIAATCAEKIDNITVTYGNLTNITPNVVFYESDGTTPASYDHSWIDADFDSNNDLDYLISDNSGDARTAYLKIHASGDEGEAYSELITITQEAYVATVTYNLATSIVSGKHYIIVGEKDDVYKAMSTQNTNNRTAVSVTENNGSITFAENAGIREFVIYGPDASGHYSIYDGNENSKGYLYAASGGNYLKTQATNNINGKWTITFDGNTNFASIVADGSSNRNVMQYNGSSSLFSCYASASQKDLYLYEKAGEAKPTVDVTITAATWASFSCANALDFTGTGVTAYIAKAKDENNVTLTEITKVPAETGIVVNATAGTYHIPVLTDAKDETTGNLLTPWLKEGTPSAATYYTLAVSGTDPIFKKSSGGTLAAGKAYLVMPTTSAPVLNISFENADVTGINTVQGSEFMVKGSGIYNLKGQKVSQPTKGLYIVNGKKVIIK